MILSESARQIITESDDKIASLAAAYWLYEQHNEVNENKLKEFIDSKVYFVEEIMKIKEEIAVNNTSGVEVNNPGAVSQKKKKTVKDLLVRRLGK